MFGKFDRNPTPTQLKEYGRGMAALSVIFYGLAAWSPLLGQHPFSMFTHLLCWSVVALFLVIAQFYPTSLKPLFRIWTGFAMILGSIVGPIVLTFFYMTVVVPVSLVSRLAGKRWLTTNSSQTLWRPISKDQKPNLKNLF